jgi:hypothetical protein
LTLALALVGCGGGDDDDDKGARGSPSAGLPLDELCASRCQLQVDAGCASIPPNYLESCTAICLAKYSSFPNCEMTLRELDACGIDRVTYGCTNNVISATPTGACADEGAACARCTGDLLLSCL